MTDNQEAEAAEEDAAEDADEQQDEAESTGLEHGDFVRLAYTARAAESGQLVDTTDPEIAEEEGVDDEGHTFEPRTIVLGEGHVFPPVEEAIVGGEPGEEGDVTVPAEEAFGEKDPDQVRTVSADKIPEDDRYPGGHVQIDGEHGHIEAIIGGRARVDFNHPLAGEDIEYEYEVLAVVEDRVEQAKGLFSAFIEVDVPEMRIETDEVEEEQLVEDEDEEDDEDSEPEYETVTVEKETLYIEATPELNMNQQWMFSKQQIAQQIIDRLDLDRVIVQEVIDGMGAGPMGGMMGGMGGGDVDLEDALEDADLEDADIDADEIVDELEEE